MDDLELEHRLAARLIERFGSAQPPAHLAASVQRLIATPTSPVGLSNVRIGRLRVRFGWSAIAAVVVVAIVAIAGVRGSLIGPGATPSPSAAAGIPTLRYFIVLPPVDAAPTKTESSLAVDVLGARLGALMFRGEASAFTSGVGNAITFRLPMSGPSDESISTVLRAQGEVSFVPLPESYTNGTHTAFIGQNLPTDEPALFGWDGISSAAMDVDQQGNTVLSITLRPAAAQAFADYTEASIGGTFAIVIDDDVALLPMVNSPIPGGEVQVSGGGAPGSAENTAFLEAAAILVGGKLPPAWSSLPPGVPEIMQPNELAASLARELPEVNVESADLDAILQGRQWIAVWRAHLGGRVAEDVCPQLAIGWQRALQACPVVDSSIVFIFNAETGEFISTQTPTP